MKQLNLFNLFTLLIILGTANRLHALEEFLSPKADVRLSIKAALPVMQDDRRILFEITNVGNDVVEYDASLAPHGLDFQLLNRNGETLPIEDHWFRFNSPRNPNIISSRYRKLQPGDRLEYILSLKEAFGEAGQIGTHLKIDWFTISTAMLPPLISGTCDLSKLFANHQAPVSSPRGDARPRPEPSDAEIQPHSPASPDATASKPEEIPETGSSLWSGAVFALLLAGTCLSWFLLKRRK